MVEAHEMKNSCVEVMNVDALFDGAQADLVRSADDTAGLRAAAGHPHAEAPGIVIASEAFFVEGRPSEFAAPDDERLIEQAARFQVGEQTRNRAIGLSAIFRMITFQI